MSEVKRLTVGWVMGLLVCGLSQAAPPNTPVLDGVPNEYDAMDWVGTRTNVSTWGAGNVVSNLYVTWDDTYLYVALEGREDSNKLAVLIDVDPGGGTGATTTTNWVSHEPGAIGYNDVGWAAAGGIPFGLDYMVSSEGFYNNFLQVLYDGEQPPAAGTNVVVLFDQGNGSTPQLSPVDMTARTDGGETCEARGIEARIPWSVLYGTNRFGAVGSGQVVPVGATLRLFANLHNNDNGSSYSSPEAIPEQVSASSIYTNGLLITDDYVDVVIDGDGDGYPDLGAGDVNAPYLKAVTGAEGGGSVFVNFNETVTDPTAGTPGNYLVDGAAPTSVTRLGDRSIRLDLATTLPAGGSQLKVIATGVEDAAANARTSEACLTVASGGIASDVTVTFVLETASGFGASASSFHLNSGSFPLEEGMPPATSTALTNQSGSLYAVDVTFPAGTPRTLFYRYSALRTDTGTNTYEAIRLDNYESTRRRLALNNTGTSMVVTDYLGAAAAPYRTGNTGYDALYADPARGDAGVRERTRVLFQLDLNTRNLTGVSRVLIQGTDPLRGFNANANNIADWAGSLGWIEGGLDLFDDGSHGDLVSGDGIYSLEWALTTDGKDGTLVPGSPYSLVGGQAVNPVTFPYGGFWADRRSPRSFSYKFYVLDSTVSGLESPGTNLDVWITDGQTNLVLDPFVWANNALPILTAANPATILAISRGASETTIVYTNISLAADNAVEAGDEPGGTWTGYGLVGAGAGGLYTAVVANATNATEVYRIITPGHPGGFTTWDPNVLPLTGGTVRVTYNQNHKALAGHPEVYWMGANGGLPNWTPTPMTFAGSGQWYIDLNVPSNSTASAVQFVITDAPPQSIYEKNGGNDYFIKINPRASWTPLKPKPGDMLTVTYNAAGGPLAGRTDVNIWWGVDGYEGSQPGWDGSPGTYMSNIGTNLWTVDLYIPATAEQTVNWVFNAGLVPPSGNAWDSSNGDWILFLDTE